MCRVWHSAPGVNGSRHIAFGRERRPPSSPQQACECSRVSTSDIKAPMRSLTGKSPGLSGVSRSQPRTRSPRGVGGHDETFEHQTRPRPVAHHVAWNAGKRRRRSPRKGRRDPGRPRDRCHTMPRGLPSPRPFRQRRWPLRQPKRRPIFERRTAACLQTRSQGAAFATSQVAASCAVPRSPWIAACSRAPTCSTMPAGCATAEVERVEPTSWRLRTWRPRPRRRA